ncbi:TetR family transcriptional regulator C-terminal domain-containing protein [Leucobacter chironomi]|uniref:TetR family transcriptional regulator C-terminal domain-containing protein n=1 Tax=Leucobacter chironomi TaxID=491918 RepID=UPI00041D2EA5|nr:TetR family transcriptional regulator C-terminal domain-containing protein [Leucobacter chironomi]
MDSRAPRRRLSVDERRAEILRCAVEVTRECGLAGLTLSEVRARAGVSAGLSSHYFTSLDGLRVAVFEELFDSVAVPDSAPPARRLALMIGDFAATDADAIANASAWVDAVLLGRSSDALRRAVARRMRLDRAEMTEAIREGCDAGAFRSDDAERSAQRILVALDGYLMQFLTQEDAAARVALRRVVWDIAERELGVGEGGLRGLVDGAEADGPHS